ncbi:MAG TPA: hypothetical protein VH227_02650 [Candidatus Udaeobacter sp.]|nr:hypothetical protein [Candidatus Udaeobacter sp.]
MSSSPIQTGEDVNYPPAHHMNHYEVLTNPSSEPLAVVLEG